VSAVEETVVCQQERSRWRVSCRGDYGVSAVEETVVCQL
jgi:hypothetical protein